ncbi:hypothetical protein ACHWQZ_G013005 [Mnemiopsis leidyi]
MNPSVYCASYYAVTPIHCTVHLKETDISLKGPKYHNLMEDRLLQSRLNHLENQLRRTTLVTQRQQLHIQKTLNNLPKPSKNLDRRVAEAFRFIMAEEMYLKERVDTVATADIAQRSCSAVSTQSSDSSRESSSSSSADEQNRLLRVVQRKPSVMHAKLENTTVSDQADTSATSHENWKVVNKKIIPAIRFQRRVLVMEPTSAGSQRSDNHSRQENNSSKVLTDEKKVGLTKNNLWRTAVMVAKQKQVAFVHPSLNKADSEPHKHLQPVVEPEHFNKAWRTISYRRKTSEDVTNKWKSLVGAIRKNNRV